MLFMDSNIQVFIQLSSKWTIWAIGSGIVGHSDGGGPLVAVLVMMVAVLR